MLLIFAFLSVCWGYSGAQISASSPEMPNAEISSPGRRLADLCGRSLYTPGFFDNHWDLYVTNNCHCPINYMLNYIPYGIDQWTVGGAWTVNPGETAKVAYTTNRNYYWAAYLTGNSGFAWYGDGQYQGVCYGKSYSFRAATIGAVQTLIGDHTITLTSLICIVRINF